ncbi:hypothetical protein F5Y14DRAFT_415149 [Nemania sp. NC0429]|nr:hypothetical protein F5Y14DRAFT_415149 [Nemania sp. NC0429]
MPIDLLGYFSCLASVPCLLACDLSVHRELKSQEIESRDASDSCQLTRGSQSAVGLAEYVSMSRGVIKDRYFGYHSSRDVYCTGWREQGAVQDSALHWAVIIPTAALLRARP